MIVESKSTSIWYSIATLPIAVFAICLLPVVTIHIWKFVDQFTNATLVVESELSPEISTIPADVEVETQTKLPLTNAQEENAEKAPNPPATEPKPLVLEATVETDPVVEPIESTDTANSKEFDVSNVPTDDTQPTSDGQSEELIDENLIKVATLAPYGLPSNEGIEIRDTSIVSISKELKTPIWYCFQYSNQTRFPIAKDYYNRWKTKAIPSLLERIHAYLNGVNTKTSGPISVCVLPTFSDSPKNPKFKELFVVISAKIESELSVLAFQLPPKKRSGTLETYLISVDEVEAATGFDLFRALSTSEQFGLESPSTKHNWNGAFQSISPSISISQQIE